MPIQDGCISKNRWKNKFIVPLSSFCLLAFFFTCGTMWSECLKTCSPSRDLLVVRSLFFCSEESRISDSSWPPHFFFCADVSVCCCFGFILKRRQQVHHHTRPLYCIFHCCLNAQQFLPACLYVRTYEIRSFEPGLTHTHTHAQEREISRWPLASTACCACVYAEHVTSAYKNSWRRLD